MSKKRRYKFHIESIFQEKSTFAGKIIQDTTNVSWIDVFSPVHKGIRDKDPKCRDLVFIKYADKYWTSIKTDAKQSHFDQALKVPVIRREVKVLRDDWSSTDTVDDFYTIANSGKTPLRQVLVRTELFRDELEIFDADGRKLPFESQKE